MNKLKVDLKKYQKHLIDRPCNICGSKNLKKLYKEERFGAGVNVVFCRDCGLIFLNPRWDDSSYRKFYEADYRKLLGEDKRPLEDCLEQELMHGSDLVSFAGNFVKKSDRVLDIGSSTGGVLKAFQMAKDCRVEGLEPTRDRAEFSRKKLQADVTEDLFENASFKGKFYDLVIITQTLNHLFDPSESFKKIRNILKDDGLLLVEVLNYFEHMKLMYKPTQVDHIYYFTPESLENLIRSTGFSIVNIQIDTAKRYKTISRFFATKKPNLHMRVLLRKEKKREIIKINDRKTLKNIGRQKFKNNFKIQAAKLLGK